MKSKIGLRLSGDGTAPAPARLHFKAGFGGREPDDFSSAKVLHLHQI
ncbi:MAG: hypothetical protein ABI651_08740 [Verrucomicrobiota bacterium]